KGAATGFPEDEWFVTLKKAWYMDELITKHDVIMSKYDPDKRVGMIIDEWGTWYNPEPGTNPGFLYQQNSIRDAIVAGLHFNIFHEHADRVQMANIAQTVNVLQAMILTEGEKMLLTPTYHVFDMFKVHQDASLLAVDSKHADYKQGDESLPQTSVSASKDENGQVHVSICNLDHENPADLTIELRGTDVTAARIQGTILTADEVDAHNTFEQPDNVKPVEFTDYKLQNSTIQVTLPPMSVVLFAVK